MFTTSSSFHIFSLNNLANKPITLQPSVTLSSWSSPLHVSLIILVIRATLYVSSLSLASTYSVWIFQGSNIQATSMKFQLGWKTWGWTPTFCEMIIVSRLGILLCLSSVLVAWLCLGWRPTFYIFSILLMIENPGSITVILILSKTEKLFIIFIWAFHLTKIIAYKFLLGIEQTLQFW